MTQEIRQLDDAILYEMQAEDRTGFSWRELLGNCKVSMMFIDVYKNTDTSGNAFIHEVLGNIENLENNGLVTVNRRGKFILRIDLTERGKDVIKSTIFTDQNGMAKDIRA